MTAPQRRINNCSSNMDESLQRQSQRTEARSSIIGKTNLYWSLSMGSVRDRTWGNMLCCLKFVRPTSSSGI